MRRRGLTLLEAVVAASMLLGLVGIAVLAFDYGVRSCALAGARADLQTQAQRVLTALQNDARRTTDDSLTDQARTVTVDGALVHRDGLSLISCVDWSGAPGTCNVTTGQPNFDRYVVYYATTPADGKLIRALVSGPAPADPFGPPLDGFSLAVYGNDEPELNGGSQLSYTVLSEQVQEFEVRRLPDRRLQARLKLSSVGLRGPSGGRKRVDQVYEMVVEVLPANTVPSQY